MPGETPPDSSVDGDVGPAERDGEAVRDEDGETTPDGEEETGHDVDDRGVAVTVAEEPTACSHTEYSSGPAIEDLPATGQDAVGVERDVWEALRGIEDPEMPISIVDLGLVYAVAVEEGTARVTMTLTYTGCPARQLLLSTVEEAVAGVTGVETVDLELVWNPPWSVEMVTESGRQDLREFGVSI